MGDRLKYERFLWFHSRVKAGRFPNAGHLAEKYEVSPRTAQRDIEFMRDRFNAPLGYDYSKKGYFYTDNSFELTSLLLNEENIIALSLAVRLASSIPDNVIKEELCGLFEKIFRLHGAERSLCFQDIAEKISVKNIEYSRVDKKTFNTVVSALFRKTPLLIRYYSPHKDEETERTIFPLHLIQYMGSWHIIAYCVLRKDLRDFTLARIISAGKSEETVSLPEGLCSIKDYTRRHFGIMQGGRAKEVCLRFSPSVAGWMKEQVWHPHQKISFDKDGSLTLRFPVSDFRELKRKVLSYGSDVSVISPKNLADDIRDEIKRMKKIYK
jgi:predicted DNA-binding transcriptional regulator YafY